MNQALLHSQYGKYIHNYIGENYNVQKFEMELDGTFDDFVSTIAGIGAKEHFDLVIANNQNTKERHNFGLQETMNLMTREIVFQLMKTSVDQKLN